MRCVAVGNEGAIKALIDFIANSQNDYRNRMQALESLRLIDPGNEAAIAALIKLITKLQSKFILKKEAYSL